MSNSEMESLTKDIITVLWTKTSQERLLFFALVAKWFCHKCGADISDAPVVGHCKTCDTTKFIDVH